MRGFSRVTLAILLSAMVVYLCSCTGGGTVDSTDPILPSPEIKEGSVDPINRIITITKDDITVIVQHWSKYRLNRKYTTVDMRSPFYYLETWEEGFRSDVYHVTIKNDTPRKLIVLFDETMVKDERDYIYKPQTFDELKYRYVTKKHMDLKTKRGLVIARQIILSEVLGPKAEIPAGETVEGFLPFNVPSSQATKVNLTIAMEKEPETATGSYEPIEFQFAYIQDLILRAKQPATKR